MNKMPPHSILAEMLTLWPLNQTKRQRLTFRQRVDTEILSIVELARKNGKKSYPVGSLIIPYWVGLSPGGHGGEPVALADGFGLIFAALLLPFVAWDQRDTSAMKLRSGKSK